MKQVPTIFLQASILLFGVAVFAVMIWFPTIEGRAENLDLLSIYLDPLILYVYASSVVFFIALYKAFSFFGNIRKNQAFTQQSLSSLNTIKKCAFLLSVLIVVAGVYIRIFHNKDDDPAGFLAISILTAFISIVIAAVASVFERIFQKEMKNQESN